MKLSPLYIALLIIFPTLPAFAETSVSINDSVSVDNASAAAAKTVISVSFSDEGLDDEDLNSDLAAEALPTANSFLYRWERFRNNIQSVFTFNAEKKAIHYRFRLHQLDRKLAACAEIGDEQCISKVEKHIQSLETRADNFIAKRQELKEQLLDKFDQWRTDRNARIEDLKQRAAERRAKRQEFREQRKEKRAEAKENRQKRREELKQRQQNRQYTAEQRQQNREQLIEMRSQSIKNKLDATRDQVKLHNQELEQIYREAQ